MEACGQSRSNPSYSSHSRINSERRRSDRSVSRSLQPGLRLPRTCRKKADTEKYVRTVKRPSAQECDGHARFRDRPTRYPLVWQRSTQVEKTSSSGWEMLLFGAKDTRTSRMKTRTLGHGWMASMRDLDRVFHPSLPPISRVPVRAHPPQPRSTPLVEYITLDLSSSLTTSSGGKPRQASVATLDRATQIRTRRATEKKPAHWMLRPPS